MPILESIKFMFTVVIPPFYRPVAFRGAAGDVPRDVCINALHITLRR